MSGTEGTGATLGEYCGWRENINLTSSSNIMTVEFMTDETREYYGFIGSYASGKISLTAYEFKSVRLQHNLCYQTYLKLPNTIHSY